MHRKDCWISDSYLSVQPMFSIRFRAVVAQQIAALHLTSNVKAFAQVYLFGLH